MVAVYLGLGSNIQPESNLLAGLELLEREFGSLTLSPVYESEAVGFVGDCFWNMVVGTDMELQLTELIKVLKTIEDSSGRDRSGPKFGSRTLDIDILTYGTVCGESCGVWLPREEIFEQAYVLRPLADIAPDLVLPGQSQPCSQLWQQFNHAAQPLRSVELEWPSILSR